MLLVGLVLAGFACAVLSNVINSYEGHVVNTADDTELRLYVDSGCHWHKLSSTLFWTAELFGVAAMLTMAPDVRSNSLVAVLLVFVIGGLSLAAWQRLSGDHHRQLAFDRRLS